MNSSVSAESNSRLIYLLQNAVIDFERVERNQGMQLIEFLAVRQLFREHDLADLPLNGHASILSELRLSR